MGESRKRRKIMKLRSNVAAAALLAPLGLFVSQADADVHHWTGQSGGAGLAPPSGLFELFGNWQEGATPGATDIASFDLNTTYTVELAEYKTLDQINVSIGVITFQGQASPHVLTLTALKVVDNADAHFVGLDLTSLETVDINSGGELFLNGRLLETQSLYVQTGSAFHHEDGGVAVTGGTWATGGGDFTLNGATATDQPVLTLDDVTVADTLGEVVIGDDSYGEMNVRTDARITSGAMTLGAQSTGEGSLTLTGSGVIWNGTDVLVGGGFFTAGGVGSVSVLNRAQLITTGETIIWGGDDITVDEGTFHTGSIVLHSAASMNVNGDVRVNGSGSSVNDGSITFTDGAMTFDSVDFTNNGAFIMEGGRLFFTGCDFIDTAGMEFRAGAINASGGGWTPPPGDVIIDGATAGASATLILGDLSGPISLNGALEIGENNTGAVELIDGTQIDGVSYLSLADAAGTATLTLSDPGTMLTINGSTHAAYPSSSTGQATINVQGGAVLNAGDFYAEADVNVSGAGSVLETGKSIISYNAPGTVTVSNGGKFQVNDSNSSVGSDNSGNGNVTVTGDGSQLVVSEWDVGRWGRGEVHLFDSADATITSMYLGTNRDAYGEVIIDGAGSFLYGWTVRVGYDGKGRYTVRNGGRSDINSMYASYGYDWSGQYGVITVTGDGSELVARSRIRLGGEDGPVTRASFNVEDHAEAWVGDELEILDDGVARLSSGVLHATTISLVDGNSEFEFTGGALDCDTFNGDLNNNGGAITPGGFDSIGTTHITGHLLNASGSVDIELMGDQCDTVIVDDFAHLAGTINANMLPPKRRARRLSDEYTIITAANGVTGAFAYENLPAGYSLVYESNAVKLVAGAPCPWDTAPAPGGDGTVGLGDLNGLLSNWGPCPAPCPYDFAPEGGDGTVGLGDLNALLSNWGPCP
jgi:T5SS/PEP-CTERM-associated repeat protein